MSDTMNPLEQVEPLVQRVIQRALEPDDAAFVIEMNNRVKVYGRRTGMTDEEDARLDALYQKHVVRQE